MQLIYACVVSTPWGLPGLRIGWLASKDAQLLDRVAELKDYTTKVMHGESS